MNKPQARFHLEARKPRWRLAAGALAMAALVVTACSAGAVSPTVPRGAGPSVTTIPQNHAMLLAVQCLRQHGIVNLPDPIVASSGPARGQAFFDKRALLAYPESVVDQAVAACSTALGQAGVGSGPPAPALTQQQIQSRLALARCLRSHGVPDFPDPNPTTGDVTLPPGLTKTSPQLLAAAQACRSLATAAGFSVPGNAGGGSA